MQFVCKRGKWRPKPVVQNVLQVGEVRVQQWTIVELMMEVTDLGRNY